MTQITFEQYTALQKQIKDSKNELNTARYALQNVADVLSNKDKLVYTMEVNYENHIRDLRKEIKYLKRRLSKYEETQTASSITVPMFKGMEELKVE